MWNIDREAAKAAGYTDAEIDSYMASLVQKEVQPTADVVSPFKDVSNLNVTQAESSSHPAVDIAPTNPEQTVPMTNPIGGVPFSGTVPNGQGYGNYYGTIGASPAELAQMTPEEKVRMTTMANEIMSGNPSNEEANARLAASFPGKNVNFSGHLANALPADPQGVATGSAQLTMGSTGNSTGTHVHNQGVDTTGQPTDYMQLMDLIRNRMYR
jgi:hypothetical protein